MQSQIVNPFLEKEHSAELKTYLNSGYYRCFGESENNSELEVLLWSLDKTQIDEKEIPYLNEFLVLALYYYFNFPVVSVKIISIGITWLFIPYQQLDEILSNVYIDIDHRSHFSTDQQISPIYLSKEKNDWIRKIIILNELIGWKSMINLESRRISRNAISLANCSLARGELWKSLPTRLDFPVRKLSELTLLEKDLLSEDSIIFTRNLNELSKEMFFSSFEIPWEFCQVYGFENKESLIYSIPSLAKNCNWGNTIDNWVVSSLRRINEGKLPVIYLPGPTNLSPPKIYFSLMQILSRITLPPEIYESISEIQISSNHEIQFPVLELSGYQQILSLLPEYVNLPFTVIPCMSILRAINIRLRLLERYPNRTILIFQIKERWHIVFDFFTSETFLEELKEEDWNYYLPLFEYYGVESNLVNIKPFEEGYFNIIAQNYQELISLIQGRDLHLWTGVFSQYIPSERSSWETYFLRTFGKENTIAINYNPKK